MPRTPTSKWEYVCDDRDSTLYRAVVPGGWLYKTVEFSSGVSVVFVPNNDKSDAGPR